MAGKVRWKTKKLLDERHISVANLAHMTGLGYRTALDIYNEKYDRIGLPTLAKLCDALEVDLPDLLVYEKD
jgi:putative transcriptional regulator